MPASLTALRVPKGAACLARLAHGSGMFSRWQWLLRQFAHRLWVRVALLSLLGIISALVSAIAAPWIPIELSVQIGADAVDSILTILASSMLAVTAFSVTTMVSAYSSATNTVTPRATKILIADSTTQNALSTFIGSFLYSLVGIIALSTGLYGAQGRVVLMIATIGVIILIVVTLIRWIDHLARLGRVGDTTDRIERATTKALKSRLEHPHLGGRALFEPARDIPANAQPVHAEKIGYVQHIDMSALSALAERYGGQIYVTGLPGTLIEPSRPLVSWVGPEAEEIPAAVIDAVTIDDERSFEQDPRFGLSVLAEIASRALSPAMNDAGTAIDVIGRAVRMLSMWALRDEHSQSQAVPCPRIYVPGLRAADMFDDIFAPIARDGAALIEVQIRLQKALHALAKIGDVHFAEQAARHARRAVMLSDRALVLEEERTLVAAIAEETCAIAVERRGVSSPKLWDGAA